MDWVAPIGPVDINNPTTVHENMKCPMFVTIMSTVWIVSLMGNRIWPACTPYTEIYMFDVYVWHFFKRTNITCW